MSLKPGIGADAMVDVASVLTTDIGAQEILRVGNVPSSLSYGKKKLPLGRYLMRKLREEVGLNEESVKKETMARFAAEVEIQLEGKTFFFKETIKDILVAEHHQAALKQEARFKIFAEERKL